MKVSDRNPRKMQGPTDTALDKGCFNLLVLDVAEVRCKVNGLGRPMSGLVFAESNGGAPRLPVITLSDLRPGHVQHEVLIFKRASFLGPG